VLGKDLKAEPENNNEAIPKELLDNTELLKEENTPASDSRMGEDAP
jgi:hypothetical protein